MKKSAILPSILMLFALGNPLAKATVITSSSDPALGGALLDNFNSSTIGTYSTFYLNSAAINGSGNVRVQNDYQGQYNTVQSYIDNNEGFTSVIRFNFKTLTSAVGFNYGALDDSWTLRIFDSNNNLLGSTTVPANGGSNAGEFIGLSSTTANIAYATFTDSSSGDWILLDNLYALQVDAIALNLRAINLGAVETATRDVNARLYRLRAFGSDQSNASSNGSHSATMDSRGKLVLPAQSSRHLEVFAQGDFGTVDRESSASISGFGGWTEAGTAGVEYGITNNLTTGLALGYVHNETKVADGTGKVVVNGGGISTYASWAKDNFYVDGLYNFTVLNDDIRRNLVGGGAALASPNNFSNKVELNAGRNFTVSHGLVFGPTASVKYVHGYIGSYTDDAGVSVQSQRYDSLISELGMQASLPKSVSFGRVTPQVRAGWGHQYLNGSEAVGASMGAATAIGMTPSPVRDYATIGAGVLAEIGSRTSVMFDYQTNISNAQIDSIFSVRAGYQF